MINFLYNWQTLIGSLLAVVAAIATVWYMRAQIRGDEERHANELARKKLAARASMPDALSEMASYIRDCAQQLLGKDKLPALPIGGLNALKAAIEHIDDHEVQKTFELVSWYQVQHARLTGNNQPKGPELNEAFYDVVHLQFLVDRLFDYARNLAQTSAPEKASQRDMLDALKSAVSVEIWIEDQEKFDGVLSVIGRRHSGPDLEQER